MGAENLASFRDFEPESLPSPRPPSLSRPLTHPPQRQLPTISPPSTAISSAKPSPRGAPNNPRLRFLHEPEIMKSRKGPMIPSAQNFTPLPAVADISYLDDRAGHGTFHKGAFRSDFVVLPYTFPYSRGEIMDKWPTIRNLDADDTSFFGENLISESGTPRSVMPGELQPRLVTPRHPASRRDVFLLRDWLGTALLRCNHKHRNTEGNSIEMLEAVREAMEIYRCVMQELTRQVSVQCLERGLLLKDLWNCHTFLFARLIEHFPRERVSYQMKAKDLTEQVQMIKDAALNERIDNSIKYSSLEAKNDEFMKTIDELRERRRETDVESVLSSNEYLMLKKQLDEVTDQRNQALEGLEELKVEHAKLKEIHEQTKRSFDMKRQQLETAEHSKVSLQDKVFEAEAECKKVRDELQSLKREMENCSPRPTRNFGKITSLQTVEGNARLEPEQLRMLNKVVTQYRSAPLGVLASLLLGESCSGHSLEEHKSRYLGCLQQECHTSNGAFSPSILTQAMTSGYVGDIIGYLTEEQVVFIQQSLQRRIDIPSLVAFLTCNIDGKDIDQSIFGQLVGFDRNHVEDALELGRVSTCKRFEVLQDELHKTREANTRIKRQLAQHEKELKMKHMETKLEQLASARQKRPLELFAEKDWSGSFVGLGTGPDVPKILRHGGKVKRKDIGVKELLAMIKLLWASRSDAEGKNIPLEDFIVNFLSKKGPTEGGGPELSYNFVYSLYRHKHEHHECELMICMPGLMNEVKEEVYHDMVRLVKDLETVLRSYEIAQAQKQGKEDMGGVLPVNNIKDILKVMFPQKSEDRMSVLSQALSEASSMGNVAYKNLFADEAETKYEALVHCIKSQYVRERVEYWKSLEKNLYAEANHRDNCTKGQLSSALALNDGFLSAKAIDRIVAPFFTTSDQREMPIRDVLEALNQTTIPSLMRAEDVMSTSRRVPSPDIMDTSGRHRSASFL